MRSELITVDCKKKKKRKDLLTHSIKCQVTMVTGDATRFVKGNGDIKTIQHEHQGGIYDNCDD